MSFEHRRFLKHVSGIGCYLTAAATARMMSFDYSVCYVILLTFAVDFLQTYARQLNTALSSNCHRSNYLCLNGNCKQRNWYCDGDNDCGDGSDELYCEIGTRAKCPSYDFFPCGSVKCIPMRWKCDGTRDCPDGRDEENCRDLSFALMALICVAKRGGINAANLIRFANDLRARQCYDGSFGDPPTTAIALQAFIAQRKYLSISDHVSVIETALDYLIQQRTAEGNPFGSLLNTCYVVPTLHYKSLLDVNSNHCSNKEILESTTEIAMPEDPIANNIHVKYRVSFGDNFDVLHSITVCIHVNSTFMDVMEKASMMNPIYSYKYIVEDSKPYVYEINGIQDDPERQKYWFLCNGTSRTATPILKSPKDVFVKENRSFLMWYRMPFSRFLTDDQGSGELPAQANELLSVQSLFE